MTSHDADACLAALEERQRNSLELRRSILAVVQDAEQALSSGVPAFKVEGLPVARPPHGTDGPGRGWGDHRHPGS